MGLDPLGLDFESYSVPEVTEELRDQTGPSYRLAASRSSGKLRIQTPTPESLKEISEKAKTLGDRVVLSKADTGVLALALDLLKQGKTPVIVSDDYGAERGGGNELILSTLGHFRDPREVQLDLLLPGLLQALWGRRGAGVQCLRNETETQAYSEAGSTKPARTSLSNAHAKKSRLNFHCMP